MGFFSHKPQVVNLKSEEFKKQLLADKNAVLIDVRTPEEYREVRIPGARLININSSSFLSDIETLEKDKSYYLYCRSGSRSYHASVAMLNLGIEKVYNLAGGISDWNGEFES